MNGVSESRNMRLQVKLVSIMHVPIPNKVFSYQKQNLQKQDSMSSSSNCTTQPLIQIEKTILETL